MQALRREEGIPDLNQIKSVLVSYNLKSKRDEWRIPQIELHVINVPAYTAKKIK